MNTVDDGVRPPVSRSAAVRGETDNRWRHVLLAGAVLGMAACSTSNTAASSTTRSAPAEPVATATAVAPPAAAEPTEKVISFAMPDLVGKDLQSAQDLVQTHGVFLSISHDLLGSRHQIIDSNWIVCNETPKAGTLVTGTDADLEGKIDFGVVKREEQCP